MAFLDVIKSGVKRIVGIVEGGKEYRDVFDLTNPSFRQFYYYSIFPCKYIYRGLYTPWHVINSPTISNPKRTRTLFRMNMAKAACAELAGLIWSEGADIHITRNGGGDDDRLERFVLDVLHKNAFSRKMQEHIEQSAALGGGALKAHVAVKHNSDGRPIKGTEEVVIDYCMADQFVPMKWNNADVSEAVFVTRKAKGGWYYTRIEAHSWDGDTYVIKNDLYKANQRESSEQGQDILGFWCPLNEAYPELQPVVEIRGLQQPLFTYYRNPVANNVDDNSPLGVSIYGNSFPTLQALDICYDSLVREFRLGKKRVYVSAQAVRSTYDPDTEEERRFFDADNEVYEAFNFDNPDVIKIHDDTPQLRIDEHIRGINTQLSALCLQMGFSAATFTFDMKAGLRTATEVISENSKTYKTISTFQAQIKPSIESLCRNIIELGILYGIEFEGVPVASLSAGGYEIAVNMEDAVLEDSTSKIDKAIKLISSGLLSKKTAMTDPRYGLNLTEEEAEEELSKIADEKQVTAFDIDRFDVFGGE